MCMSSSIRTVVAGGTGAVADGCRRYDGRAANPVPIPQTGAIAPSGKHSDPYQELPWAERRSRLVDTIMGTGDIDIIGFQVGPVGPRLDAREYKAGKGEG